MMGRKDFVGLAAGILASSAVYNLERNAGVDSDTGIVNVHYQGACGN
jgi:hypothetical protein